MRTAEFEAWVDERVHAAIAHGQDRFPSLLVQLGDVNPIALLESVHRLSVLGRIAPEIAQNVRVEAAQSSPYVPPSPHHRMLPVPHPLDYDWRFSDSATDYLLAQHLSHGNGGGELVCIGAPSVFSAAKRYSPNLNSALLDVDGYLVTQLRRTAQPGTVLHCDLLTDPLPSWRARTIVADPPWYPEYIRAFLWCGHSLLDKGGRLFLSVPPEGTRPGIAGEMEEEIAWAQAVGLRLREVHRAQVRYVTPPFERNAMRACGIGCLPSEWRTGDIAEFELVHRNPPPRPYAIGYDSPWEEIICGSVRVRIGGDRRLGNLDPRLTSLVKGDILATVSRRDPRRNDVRVWTSGNRVFGCADPECLRVVATAVARGEVAEKAIERRLGRELTGPEFNAVRTAIVQLTELSAVEREEYGRSWSEGA